MTDPRRHLVRAGRPQVSEQAAQWYLQAQDGLDAAGRRALQAWLNQHPDHPREYAAIAQLEHDLQAVLGEASSSTPPPRSAPAAAAIPPRPKRRRHGPLWLGAAAVLVLAFSVVHQVPSSAGVRYDGGDKGQRLLLTDGTAVQLAPHTAIDVDFGAHARRIRLRHGRALFDVGKDRRPLTVRIGRTRLRDIGTVFSTERHGDRSEVTVLSGHVRVLAPLSPWQRAWQRLGGHPGDTVLAQLGSGDQADTAGDGDLQRLYRHTDLDQATAWLPAELDFDNTTVAEVARRFNAYTGTPLQVDDATLAHMRISGRFHAHDVDAFLAYLGSRPGIVVRQRQGRIHIARAATTPVVTKNSRK